MLVAKYYPKKLTNVLLGRGYFTAQRNIEMQAGLYKIIPDLILKLTKHHKIEVVRNALNELFEELKRISNHENKVLVDKVKDLLKSIELHQEIIEDKDKYLNLEINKREERQRLYKYKSGKPLQLDL